ncbi:MORC family CW-type zinc finger protein [Actinidia chinensis var. chinensis]|uniref:MORC family CW-type zinc finger protein n=1 Tax=Actinidia chinensis var. chinensis TaxID=1590841 RepID=A0A2R6PP68_ACTCC|nr:MORC family CW-type zinc finger protein [Actinidia chinensis var. chinensis]
MIYAGIKGVGVGFGSEEEMEETELEEGETCSYQNGEDSTIDPDVTLSYIDEKLQYVLGHFQKDFEGGVSAENLGAKFGGYGSFLPVQQRSPVQSHTKTPSKISNTTTSTSPNNLHLEGGHHNPIIPSSASLSAKHGPSSVSSALLSSLRTSLNDSSKGDVGMSSTHFADESTLRCDLVKSCAPPSDQKTIKVRIKVGSDNFSTKKNADIYSGLGLDISPSSSLDASPTDSEGFSHGPLGAPDESPTSILQIMTSFPVHGSLLLSPLPYALINLIEKEKLQGESKPRRTHRYGQERLNGSDSERGDSKVLGDKKPISVDNNAFSVELKNHSKKGIQNDTGVLLKKETNIDTSVCEVVAKAAKLPHVSNSYSNVVNSEKATAKTIDNSRVANKVKVESFSNLAKEETLEAVFTQESHSIEKSSGKAVSSGKVLEDKNTIFHNGISVYPGKDGHLKVEKTDGFAKTDSSVSKEMKSQNAEPVDPSELKVIKKGPSHEKDDMHAASRKEHSSSGTKKKSKGSQTHGTQGAEILKDSPRMDSSFVSKNRKSKYKSEVDDSKLEKAPGEAKYIYSDFFGDIELEQGDNDVDSAEMLSDDGPKGFEAVGKSTFASNSTSKEMLNGKKMETSFISEAHIKEAPNAAPITGNGPISNVLPATTGPVVKEDWVCCDKCQKWRLLPLGTNPESLPEKWLCSMLNWLPGMNRCSISEEETTKAVVTLHQFPAPGNHNNQNAHPCGVLPGLSLADASRLDQNHQNLGCHDEPGVGKKKNEIKEVVAAVNQDGPAQFPNSMKKNIPAKSRSLNGANQSPTPNEIESRHLSKSLVVEKHRNKQKEKNKLREHHSDGGQIRSSKTKSKKVTDQDCIRVSKKTKVDDMHRMEDWMLDSVGKEGPSLRDGLSVNASGKVLHKYDDHPCKDRKFDANESSKSSSRNPKDQVLVTLDDGTLHLGRFDDKDVVRKRKMNESEDTHVYTAPAPLHSGYRLNNRRDFLEETSDNNHRKEKKARVSKSEGKETSVSEGSGVAAKKGRSTKDRHFGTDQGITLSQQSLDAPDSLRRDSGSAQPSEAATSSSSKVSGSHKNRSCAKEVKGSPVESVSSSPLRLPNPDKSGSKRSLEGKDDSGDACLFVTGTPRRCSYGENDRRSNQSGRVRKDETFVTNPAFLDSSVVDYQETGVGHLAGIEAKIQMVHSPEFANSHFANGGNDTLGHGTQDPFKPQTSDQCCDEERKDEQYHANVSHSRQSGKGSSSRSKEKCGTSKSVNKGKIKVSDSCNESVDHATYGDKSRSGKNRIQEKFGISSGRVENKESAGKKAGENGKKQSQSILGGNDGLDVKLDADRKQNLRLDRDERSSRRLLSEKTDLIEVSGRGKSHSLPPSGRVQNDTVTRSLHLVPGSQKENGANSMLLDTSLGDDALKAPKQINMSGKQNGNQPIKSRYPTTNGHKVRGVDAPSSVRRDSSTQAATKALKEAKDLKHVADRLKNSGSNAEGTSFYFQAALKFLYGASLLESSNGESAKQGEMIQSMQIYSSTAKLCEFCAREYEKSKDLAAAALAYKCTEVAYMRVICSSHSSAGRDRYELQTALQIVPSGESPSSSASDVDNMNNPSTLDKVPLAKGVSSPQVAGNHVIAAQNRPNFVRLLNFDVNFAMEASRKSRTAFAAANPRMEEAQNREGIISVKRALDFHFQDMEGLLRLVRLAMEAISR